MTLPELPLQYKSQEADFGVRFRRWWNKARVPGTFELKHTRGKASIPFSAIERDQVVFGNLARGKGILARVSAGTVGCADYIGLVRASAWVVISYPRFFAVIALSAFLEERDSSDRKSLTAERAEAIATTVVRY